MGNYNVQWTGQYCPSEFLLHRSQEQLFLTRVPLPFLSKVSLTRIQTQHSSIENGRFSIAFFQFLVTYIPHRADLFVVEKGDIGGMVSMVENEHNRVLKVPKWVMRVFFRNGLGFCIPKRSAVPIATLCIFGAVPFILLYLIFPNSGFSIFPVAGITVVGATLLSLAVFGVIVVRKDCYNCQFAFHILAHEKSHLSLNSIEEVTVEGNALDQTYNKLIPLLLSDPKMCNDCHFKWRRMYSEATSKYIEENNKRKAE